MALYQRMVSHAIDHANAQARRGTRMVRPIAPQAPLRPMSELPTEAGRVMLHKRDDANARLHARNGKTYPLPGHPAWDSLKPDVQSRILAMRGNQ